VAVGVGVTVAKRPATAPQPVKFSRPEISKNIIMGSFQLFILFNSAFITPSI